ncbi:MAG: 2OG-Fe(II) oxygenase family protein [Polyangia bacterium]
MIPLFDEASPHRDLQRACRELGAFQWRLPPREAARLRETLRIATRFFARPSEEKRALDIGRSPHHRGYSEMHNERDWREQLHLGREAPPLGDAGYLALVGPNQWPRDDAFRAAMLVHLEETSALGLRLLDAIGLPFADPYLVMKLICYRPQPSNNATRPGVAAHVDYSLLTVLAQDELGGLDLRRADGRWVPVEPLPDTLLVNLGELVEALTGGAMLATPHRVVNRSRSSARVSIPVFVNPALDAVIAPRPRAPRRDAEHVHRVLDESPRPFVFGDREWQRKGKNVWCKLCCAS